jgi:hypothetical protein
MKDACSVLTGEREKAEDRHACSRPAAADAGPAGGIGVTPSRQFECSLSPFLLLIPIFHR